MVTIVMVKLDIWLGPYLVFSGNMLSITDGFSIQVSGLSTSVP